MRDRDGLSRVRGALKSHSSWISLVVFSGCAISFFVFSIPPVLRRFASLRGAYSFFENLNVQLLALAGRSDDLLRLTIRCCCDRDHRPWLAALIVYRSDYAIGFAVLHMMSTLHVLLELPLNHRTAVGIVLELWRSPLQS